MPTVAEQIAALRVDIVRLEDEIRAMEAEIERLKARVAALEALCQRAAYEEIHAKLRKQLQAAGRGEAIE